MLNGSCLCVSLVAVTRLVVGRRFFPLYQSACWSLPLVSRVYWLLSGPSMHPCGTLADVTMIPPAFGRAPVMGHYWTLET
ncbi:acyltransferase, partial [Burkholderia pseudomallei]